MIAAEIQVIWHLLLGQRHRGSHAERLQAFYAPQAGHYDRFRERLLHGRGELIRHLAPGAGAHVVEMGGGTGRNLLFFGGELSTFSSVYLVDLCPALLNQARARDLPRNVTLVEADAVSWRPDRAVDCVYFSYALTMIPDWRGAIDNALAMLRPGGRLGVVDFYVSERAPAAGMVRHGRFARWFWPRWFGHDGVRLDPARLAYLRSVLPRHQLTERRAPVPYLPGLRVPYYLFVGET
ncbi:MAG: methyltransferase domain-containing protein [Chromatiaceae bacterium]|nr:methyltransferase domain-containing protein [Chromatiaceae bacterium]